MLRVRGRRLGWVIHTSPGYRRPGANDGQHVIRQPIGTITKGVVDHIRRKRASQDQHLLLRCREVEQVRPRLNTAANQRLHCRQVGCGSAERRLDDDVIAFDLGVAGLSVISRPSESGCLSLRLRNAQLTRGLTEPNVATVLQRHRVAVGHGTFVVFGRAVVAGRPLVQHGLQLPARAAGQGQNQQPVILPTAARWRVELAALLHQRTLHKEQLIGFGKRRSASSPTLEQRRPARRTLPAVHRAVDGVVQHERRVVVQIVIAVAGRIEQQERDQLFDAALEHGISPNPVSKVAGLGTVPIRRQLTRVVRHRKRPERGELVVPARRPQLSAAGRQQHVVVSVAETS